MGAFPAAAAAPQPGAENNAPVGRIKSPPKPLREVPSWEMILFRLSGENQMGVSAKVAARISTQLKKYQRVLEAARQRDIGEADTVTIITDLHLHPARA